MTKFKLTEKERKFFGSKCGFSDQRLSEIEEVANNPKTTYRFYENEREYNCLHKQCSRDEIIKIIGRDSYICGINHLCDSKFDSVINNLKLGYTIYIFKEEPNAKI